MNKVFIVGLDGADYSLIQELRYELPNLGGLIDKGVFGRLESTIPNISPTAWASFITGKNPGKHGILDFVKRERDDPCERGIPVNASMMKGPTIWRVLTKYGRRVGVFNVPMTYPTEEVNGFIIGGFPVPREAEDYTYPLELAEGLRKKGWNFADVALQAFSKKHLDKFLAELYERIKARTEATLYLMQRYDWDFFMVHYMETDKMLHDFLDYKYREFSDSERMYRKYKDTVKEFFVELDRQLGKIFAVVGGDANILILSDHGFSPRLNDVYLDTWMLNEGFIKLKKSLKVKAKHLLFRMGFTPELAYKLAPDILQYNVQVGTVEKYYSKSRGLVRWLVARIEALANSLFLSKSDVDWGSTEAYPYGSTGLGTIYLNRKERRGYEQTELRSRLKSSLERLLLPKSSRPIFDSIFFKEDIFEGEFLAKAPDLIVFDDSSFSLVKNHREVFLSRKVIDRSYLAAGSAAHNMNGVLIASGPDIADRRSVSARLIDVAPTVLHMMGTPIPKVMDGVVLKEILSDASLPYSEEVRYEDFEDMERERFTWSKDDEAKVIERLKRMGYLD